MEIKVLNVDQLSEIIYKDFDLADETLFDRIRYFSSNDLGYHFAQTNAYYVVAFDNAKIVGVAKVAYYKLSARHENNFSIPFLSVDKDYRGQGISKLLCDVLFKTAKERGLEISTSSYTVLGKRYLQHIFNKYAMIHNVTFYDKNESESIIDNPNMYVPYKNTFVHRDELRNLH